MPFYLPNFSEKDETFFGSQHKTFQNFGFRLMTKNTGIPGIPKAHR
jgi:hypothetical protein